MNSGIRFKLFLMMVLQFSIWGAWFPLVFGYMETLEFSATTPPKFIADRIPENLYFLITERALILMAFPISAIIGLFFSNQFADRNFAAEKFLGFSHLVGGLAILSLTFVQSYPLFLGLMWVHCLFYVPTISITNSIAFHAMKDAQQEFGIVRMGGTIGWIAVAWPLLFLLSNDPTTVRYTFLIAGIASLALAAFSLSLPHTPPKPAEGTNSGLAIIRALGSLLVPSIFVLWIVTFIDATVHQVYFVWTADFLKDRVGIPSNWIMPVMSIGQVAEILTMAVLGTCLKKLGWKTTMIIGVLGHAARFATYSYASEYPWAIVLVQVLHGICYAFFFASVYIFIDEFMPKDVRASTQGLFNFMILGLGFFVGIIMGPWVQAKHYTTIVAGKSVVAYEQMFLIPAVCALGAAAILLLLFWPPKNAANANE